MPTFKVRGYRTVVSEQTFTMEIIADSKEAAQAAVDYKSCDLEWTADTSEATGVPRIEIEQFSAADQAKADADREERVEGSISFLNYYKCPECGTHWNDEWSAMCDDTCPACGTRDISPYASEDA